MEEDNLVTDDLEECHRKKSNMVMKVKLLPVARLTARLKGELTEEEMKDLEEPFNPGKGSIVIKTEDKSKHT